MITAVELTLALPCRNACTYCPQGVLKKAYKGELVMGKEVFGAIMDKFAPDTSIHFSGFSEPFLHHAAPRMIELVSEKYKHIEVWTTLVGLTEYSVARLARVKYDAFVVHLPDGEYFKPKEYDFLSVEAARLIPNVQFLTVHTTGVAAAMWSSRLGLTVKNDPIISRSGKVDFAPQRRVRGRVRCAGDRQRQPVILPNGDMVICCNDYGLEHPIGNVVRDSVEDIEKRILAYEVDMADIGTENICNSCHRAY